MKELNTYFKLGKEYETKLKERKQENNKSKTKLN